MLKNNINIWALCLGLLLPEIWALPQYAARSARICSNCHVNPLKTPTQEAWKNPKLSERKCNMSCQGCHVNPAGGGIRNGPGRFYAMSTLPSFGAKLRPYRDAESREIFPHSKTSKTTTSSEGKVKPKGPEAQDFPSQAKFFYGQDWQSYGYPLNAKEKQSPYAYERQRLGPINADPFISFGTDFRLADWYASGENFIFPMQAEVGGALHPVEHITISATGALQGRVEGGKEDPEYKPLKIQNAYALIHELPYQAYVQAGIFLPEFGLRMEDHTLYNRKHFEMDPSRPENSVRGIQMGAAPNYPYGSFGVFQLQNFNRESSGMGWNANLYWRDVAWGVGGSYLGKWRKFKDGGDLNSFSLNGYYNLWGMFPKIRFIHPVTLQGEYVYGHKNRTSNSYKSQHSAFFQIDYLIKNGVNIKTNMNFYDDDLELKEDAIYKFGAGVDWTVFRRVRYSIEGRSYVTEAGPGGNDLIMFVHCYL